MKNSKFITAISSALLFCISGTAFASNVEKAVVNIRQSIEDHYSTPPVYGSASTTYLSDFTIPGTKLLVYGALAVAGAVVYHYAGGIETGIVMASANVISPEWLDLKFRTQKAFADAGKPIGNNQIFMPTSYRAEQLVTDDTGTYTFQFNKREKLNVGGTKIVTEHLLADNDVCVVGQIGYFLIARDNTKVASVTLLTYDNATQLATDAGGTQADYRIFYNGNMIIKTGITTTRSILTSDFYMSPGAAASQAILATGGAAAATQRDQRGYNDGYVWVGGNAPLFSGRADQTVDVTVYPFSGIDVAADTSGWGVYLVCVIRGLTLFNMAEADSVKKMVTYGFLDSWQNVQSGIAGR